MNPGREMKTLLVAEDDEDDRLMLDDAVRNCGIQNPLRFVVDGEELLDYLHHRGHYTDPQRYPHPGLILLDLNMPKLDGRSALREIKADPLLREIPVIVLTTSSSPDDISRCYQHGANAYVTKPGSYAALLDMVRNFSAFWLQTARLPETKASSPH